jgi:YHS domain-containing protein
MIDGYCPVALRDKRELKPGFRQHRAVFWGREYYLADSASLTAFREEPKRYIMGVELRYRTLNMKPQLDGYCPVTLLESATLTVGNVEHLAFFGGRLFYCVSAEARERLLAEREVVAKAQQRYEQLTRERKR